MNIITLTMNPTLDVSTSAKMVLPNQKLRCRPPENAPGGGGINVSRAIHKLGGKSLALFLAGKENGQEIANLLEKEKIKYEQIKTDGNARVNLAVFDETTKNLYRFGMPGPEVKEKYWKKMLTAIKEINKKPEYIVASGSLPRGVPDDFYAQLAQYANKNDIRLILDTSGNPLKIALEEGVYMIKPNMREMAELTGKDALTGLEQEHAAKELLGKKACEMLVLSLGAKGAMVAHGSDIIDYIVPPVMPVVSPVGAGDSMVAGIVMGLNNGQWPNKAAMYGVSAGTAAAMTPGSELCRKEDTENIYDWLIKKTN